MTYIETHGTRNLFKLEAAFIAAVTLSLAGCTPSKSRPDGSTPRPDQFVDINLITLGKELGKWTLEATGLSMSSAFPEISRVADLLQGEVDPRMYFPFINVPLEFKTTTDPKLVGAYRFEGDFDYNPPI